MSSPLRKEAAFSAADYLAWEAERVERHEYLDGDWRWVAFWNTACG